MRRVIHLGTALLGGIGIAAGCLVPVQSAQAAPPAGRGHAATVRGCGGGQQVELFSHAWRRMVIVDRDVARVKWPR